MIFTILTIALAPIWVLTVAGLPAILLMFDRMRPAWWTYLFWCTVVEAVYIPIALFVL